jgi:hypothetical protein
MNTIRTSPSYAAKNFRSHHSKLSSDQISNRRLIRPEQ